MSVYLEKKITMEYLKIKHDTNLNKTFIYLKIHGMNIKSAILLMLNNSVQLIYSKTTHVIGKCLHFILNYIIEKLGK